MNSQRGQELNSSSAPEPPAKTTCRLVSLHLVSLYLFLPPTTPSPSSEFLMKETCFPTYPLASPRLLDPLKGAASTHAHTARLGREVSAYALSTQQPASGNRQMVWPDAPVLCVWSQNWQRHHFPKDGLIQRLPAPTSRGPPQQHPSARSQSPGRAVAGHSPEPCYRCGISCDGVFINVRPRLNPLWMGP